MLSGSVELEVDNGVKQTLHAGDVCIQRGTVHLWRNTTDEVCRIIFVLTEASPVKINGEELPEIHP